MRARTKSTRKITRENRRKRIRSKVKGTPDRPRLSVFRSQRYLYVQLIDDERGKTIVESSDRSLDEKSFNKADFKKDDFFTPRMARAFMVGKTLAEKAKKHNISKVVFDKSYYKYHGRIKALAEGARAGGLSF